MKQRVALAGQTARSAHHRSTAKLAKVLAHTARFGCFGRTARQIVEINFKIAGNEEIQSAIAVKIAPGSARAPALARDSKLFSHVGKCAISVVMVKP